MTQSQLMLNDLLDEEKISQDIKTKNQSDVDKLNKSKIDTLEFIKDKINL